MPNGSEFEMSRVQWLTSIVAAYVLTLHLLDTNTCASEYEPQSANSDTAKSNQIVVRMQLIELNLSKMRRLGVDFAIFEGEENSILQKGPGNLFPLNDAKTAILDSTSSYFGFLDALCKNGVATILAVPTVTIADGHTASLTSGKNVECGMNIDNTQEVKFVGTKLDITSHFTESDKVRIKLHLDCSKLCEGASIGEIKNPKVRHREVDTEFTVNMGETFALGGPLGEVRAGDETEETELVLLVTPEFAGRK